MEFLKVTTVVAIGMFLLAEQLMSLVGCGRRMPTSSSQAERESVCVCMCPYQCRCCSETCFSYRIYVYIITSSFMQVVKTSVNTAVSKLW